MYLSKVTDKTFRPIQYLGNKTRLLDDIAEVMGTLARPGERVADLFCGTSVVGRRLADRNPVSAVDIQGYSEVIGRAMLLVGPSDLEGYDHCAFIARAEQAHAELSRVFGEFVNLEKEALFALNEGYAGPLSEIIERGSPAAIASANNGPALPQAILDMLEGMRPELPDATATLTFGGVYFSYEQAMWLDALAHATATEPKCRRPLLTAALLSVSSQAVNTVGKQFAQPIKLIDGAGRAKPLLIERTLKDRNQSPLRLFKIWLDKWTRAISIRTYEHRVIRSTVDDFVKKDNECVAYYADPPYTIDHYSRFYHVLETLVLRDKPRLARMRKRGVPVVLRGLYREDRHQSAYCIPSQAPEAFDNLIRESARRGRHLLLSYSGHASPKEQRPRLMSIEDLTSLAKAWYKSVEVIQPRFEGHRKLNAANRNAVTENGTEHLLICRS